jgi:hypothetical protein
VSQPTQIQTVDELGHELESRINTAQTLLVEARSVLGDTYANDCETVQTWIDECRRDLARPEQVAVALLGSTGAGKSTLINSLIGEQILPTSSMAVCTSSITRVRFRAGNRYSMEVKLVPRATWERQVEQAAADVAASKEVDDKAAAYVRTSPIGEDEAKRLKAIYGQEAIDEFLLSGNRTLLVEPQEIVDAFGRERIEFSCGSPSELRAEVDQYLTAKGRYWPIVETCVIEGPFAGLDHGAELVDLPGLNDPNEAREELTRSFLETAKFVWVVFNMKRSLGKDLTQVLESRDLLNRLLAGGRLSTLTFVGTHSDDVSSINPEDFGLDDESSAADIALARNEQAEVELRTNLQTIARTLASGRSSGGVSSELTGQLVGSPVFMVSASNFLQAKGKTKSRVAAIFNDVYETNVPQLSNHLRDVAVEAGPRANAVTVVSSVEEVIAELAALAQSVKTQQLLQSQQGSKAKDEFLGAVAQSSQTLHNEATGALTRLRGSLQEAVSRFKSGSAIDKAVVEKLIASKSARWSNLHWATMRATSTRGGRYSSPTFGEIDLIQDLAAPVITKAMDPWKSFFERDLPTLTRQVSDGLRISVDKYGTSLTQAGGGSDDLGQILGTLLPDLVADISDSVESALTVAQKKLSAEITRRQQELHSVTEQAISSAMASVFSRAAAERGTGMKSRMVNTLEAGAKTAVGKAIDQVQLKLADLADMAMKAVLEGITPVSDRIDEKAKRIVQMLSERPPQVDLASVEQIDKFLAKVTSARTVVSSPLSFERTDLPEDVQRVLSPAETAVSAAVDSAALSAGAPIIVDASNVARSPSSPPDIELLDDCRRAAEQFFNGRRVILIADASLPRVVEHNSSQVHYDLLNRMISDRRLVIVPPGIRGRADRFILDTATKTQGVVVSNDSYKEFHGDFPWLFEEGRLYGHTYHEVLGWDFTQRFPVRVRTY